MTVRFQIVIDCHNPRLLVQFWSSALGYQPEPPPEGFSRWADYWRDMGVPEEELVDVTDPESIVDLEGRGPRIWFHKLPDPKICKNRLHFDIRASGSREHPITIRKMQVESEVTRLEKLGATRVETLDEGGLDHYAVAMTDPEGNEFDVN